MEFQQKIEGDILVFTPKFSSLDAKNSSEFKQRIVEAVHKGHVRKVILDLEPIHFIDSSGLGSLISLLRILHSEGGNLKLTKVNKPIRNMFELVSMTKIFDIYESNSIAIHAFNEPKRDLKKEVK